MAIAFDAADSDQVTASSITKAFTTAGANRFLIVGAFIDNLSQTIDSATYNAVAATAHTSFDTAVSTRGRCFTLVNPASGANNVVVTCSGPANIRIVIISYTGVHQTTPIRGSVVNNSNTDTTPTWTVSSAVNDLVVAVWSVATQNFHAPAPGAGTTERHELLQSRVAGDEPGAASVTIGWTIGSDSWLGMALSLQPVSAGILFRDGSGSRHRLGG